MNCRFRILLTGAEEAAFVCFAVTRSTLSINNEWKAEEPLRLFCFFAMTVGIQLRLGEGHFPLM